MGFQRLLLEDEDNQLLAVREGQTLQLCVTVVSGRLPYEELFTLSPTELEARKKRGASSSASMSHCC